ncbi:heme/hemin ABC transporter substrate-binding protein [Pontibacter rugosus]|uniref:Hemin ABC transporter substrate-binding protein n=1 Tax=Pontibacter rugosus TaxID=1745966 RepID=A0ABW3SU11_9BACT
MKKIRTKYNYDNHCQAFVKRWLGISCSAALSIAIFACTPGTQEQAVAADTQTVTVPDTKSNIKIATLGGTITEIVCALDYCDNIVATDRTSTYPAHMQQLPSLGYRNNVKAEGVISTGADLVLAEADYLPEAVTEQLNSTGITQHYFQNKLSKESTQAMISDIGKLLGKEEKAQELVVEIENDFNQLNAMLAHVQARPKVLFVYARGQGTLSIGGKGTFAETMINMAGGQLAVPQIEDFKPLTAEAVVAANPDYVLLFDSGLQSIGGEEGLLAVPGIKETNAGKNRKIIAMDGHYLSGFGPRVGKAALELAQKLHPTLQPTVAAK